MGIDQVIESMVERIRGNAACEADVRELQGEVLQFKVTDGSEYRLAFRDDSVELDADATPTFQIQGRSEVFNSLFQRRLTPLAAIMTRRLKITFDPERMPRIRRIIAAGLGPAAQAQVEAVEAAPPDQLEGGG